MDDILCRPVQNEAELKESYRIRKKIFVEEQGLFRRSDRDGNEQKAIHIVAIHDRSIIGTVRVYPGREEIWLGSRLAVLKRYRGRVGKLLVQKAVEIVKKKRAKHFYARILLKNVRLFKRLGWIPVGPVIQYRGQPHQLMEADLG